MALNFDSPRDNDDFSYYWNLFIDDIRERDNLKPSHLHQFRILCDLYVEYDDLKILIDLQGRTYNAGMGRNGEQIKLTPEVQQMNRVLSEIRNYSKMLGLTLSADKTTKDEEEHDDFK